MDDKLNDVLIKAETLIEALPYIRDFNNKKVVVKYGGSAMLDEKLQQSVIKDVALLKLVGMKPIIVHGGGKEISKWVRLMGKEPEFVFSSGTEFPADLSPYKMIVHCGGCMLNEREMKYRLACAKDQNIPMTNYGILIAYIQGILKRSVEPFPAVSMMLTEEPS